MRRTMFIVLIVTGALLWLGVLVYHYFIGRPWSDAFLMAMTTIGLGEYNLEYAPPTLKIFGVFLMLVGAAALAAVYGIVTDLIMKSRLQEFFGQRRRRMQDHIVLCGLGNVGFRILEHLRGLGEEVVVIERQDNIKFVEDARSLGVTVITGDIRRPAALEKAHVHQARCLIAAADEDLANLEAALNARSANPKIHIVMRMFDQSLANKVAVGFNIKTAFSTSALAAPAFAMAAVDPSVIGSFYVDGVLMLNQEIIVNPGSKLDGLTTKDLEDEGGVSILVHVSAATGRRRFHPSESLDLAPGDKLVVSTEPPFAKKMHQLNQPPEEE
ncbi:MAG: NAD-binding protein [Thermodesulfobacteriota bacterium]